MFCIIVVYKDTLIYGDGSHIYGTHLHVSENANNPPRGLYKIINGQNLDIVLKCYFSDFFLKILPCGYFYIRWKCIF